MTIDYVRVYKDAPLSIDDSFNTVSDIKIYPNPTNNIINISSKSTMNSIALYDIYGKLMIKQNTETASIDISTFSNGVYFLEIYSNNTKEVKKVIKN